MSNKVVVIGAGNWGINLVRTFHQLGALAGVVEAEQTLRDRIVENYPDIPVFQEYLEAFNTVDATAAIIATPAHTHYSIASELLQLEKDVFVEKPITLSSLDAEKLVDIANKHNRILMVGHLLLYQPAIQKMKQLIEEGTIGTLKSIHQERMKLGRVRSVENVLWSFGVHDIAVMLFLIGSQPNRIDTFGQSILQEQVEDDVYLHLGFIHGVTAHLHNSWLWPEIRRRLTAIGTEGMIVFEEERQSLVLHNKKIGEDLSNIDNGSSIVLQNNDQPLSLECKHFLDCIRDRITPVSDGRNGLDVIRILEKASEQLDINKTKSIVNQ
ncbi:Gfo/Idh/MocA family protein [Paenibacillus koleovorans]|uniref:Gfo/Idh/MocA family protein n=1 Tax=Paenibacillus koleovorans TaxID=121608 RepID=UPI000FD89E6E|nr:Gfo/Idh/MocA family oxidoreductase [Paenibacillus koleovorans]